jgi:hypothetical protein
MRPTLIAFLIASGAAHARDCEAPDFDGKEVRGLRTFSACILDEVKTLKREQAKLLDEIERLEEALAGVPGEIRNVNGRVSRLGGDNLAQASFTVEARVREGAEALEIDQKALEDLCAIGCTLTLVLSAEGLRPSDPAATVAVGPCLFRYASESGVWARSGACGEAVTGIDGNGAPTGISGGEIIVTAGEACLLADSEPRREVDPETGILSRDREAGLFLIADPMLWKGSEDRFRCEMKLSR